MSELVTIVMDSEDDDIQIVEEKSAGTNNKNGRNSTINDDDSPGKPKKRKQDYEVVKEDPKLEAKIISIKRINDLKPEQIEYMVLRDVNYFLDIFAGECDHCWRHKEYKKFSKRGGNYLYENSRLAAYTYEQYTAAVRALQSIFCKKNYKYNEYIVKVLLPEALVKICMSIYQCSKNAAEEFLNMNFEKNPNAFPKGSTVYASPVVSK